ncbi:hypothetical protein HN748_01560 [Candidatus Peregrinibacteria bacterium]|jgi:hypothetical protein|nr:hypothetical protein [Candidatus Peregrinibacteria bacterium]MBT7483609.1 hypothetical protein [Candidatus Peregrinibacteria bacterium]MBT7702898.1 hypothetical protein [Candidatus Peregrinibacteria bacterium]
MLGLDLGQKAHELADKSRQAITNVHTVAHGAKEFASDSWSTMAMATKFDEIPDNARMLVNGLTPSNKEATRIQAGKLAYQVLKDAGIQLSSQEPPMGADFDPHSFDIKVTFYFPDVADGIVVMSDQAKEPDFETLQSIHDQLEDQYPSWGVEPIKGGVVMHVDRADVGFRELFKGRIDRALRPMCGYDM